eukprot:jgi/Orpsp1_1/1192222/evm.model.d7180000091477.1
MENYNKMDNQNKEENKKGKKNKCKDKLKIQYEDHTDGNEKVTATLDLIAKAINSQSELMKNLIPLLNAVSEKALYQKDSTNPVSTDNNGNVVMTSYDVPSNHFDDTNAFKGKDTDVERFITMCEKQFNYYVNFYASEKKRIEFIEAHLGPASEWYFTFHGNKQKEDPNSGQLLEELEKNYLTNLPDSLKLKRLEELSHKWGNAVDFVTKFKLYATQLKIPEILQLQFFEDRVHPWVKRRLMDLEPNRRTIENYSQMLINYDNEKDRYWNFDN